MREVVQLAQTLRGMLNDFKGPIELLFYLLVFWAFCRLLHLDIKDIPKKLLAEFKELADRQFTAGALNAIIVLLMFVIAIFIIASNEFKALFEFFVKIFGLKKSIQLVENSYFPMFFTFAVSGVLSLWASSRVEIELARKRKAGTRGKRK